MLFRSSPVKAIPLFSEKKQTLPPVCPGVESTILDLTTVVGMLISWILVIGGMASGGSLGAYIDIPSLLITIGETICLHGRSIRRIEFEEFGEEKTDENIKAFEATAKKYGIDFALKKDKSTSPPRHLVFFKGRDTNILKATFNEFSKKKLTKKSMLSLVRTGPTIITISAKEYRYIP